MSSTPKLDLIINEFRARISDPAVYIANVLQDGQVVPALDTLSYVNRGMFRLIDEAWQATKGDKWKFIGVFPELLGQTVSGSVTFSTPGYAGSPGVGGTSYTLASPYLDFFEILDAVNQFSIVPTIIRIVRKEYLNIIATAFSTQYTPSNANQMLVADGQILYLYPDNNGSAWTSIAFRYIKQPLNPTNGALLLQNGSYDSPFRTQWTSDIADRAVQIYLQEAQLR